MKGFLLGVIVASALWGGFFFWERQQRLEEEMARAKAASVVAAAPQADQTRGKRRRGRNRRVPLGVGQAEGAPEAVEDNQPEPIALTPADTRVVARGDDVSSPDVVHMDMSDKTPERELSQEDIDEKFRAREPQILACIESSRPDQITFIPGRVTVSFRIRRSGEVRGLRVEAPAILQKGGIYDCIGKVVRPLRFPASGGSQVVSYPYQLG